MLTRIVTAVVALGLLVPVLLFAPDWAICGVWALLCAVAVYEFASCVGLKKETVLVLCSMALSALYVFPSAISAAMLPLLLLLYTVTAVVRHGKLPVDRAAMLLGLCVYACVAFRSLAGMSSCADEHDHTLLWVTLCIPWVADSLAYFVGRFCGKRKLCPEISPKKTVEGAVGGVASTGIVAVVVYGFAVGWEFPALLWVFLAAVLLAVVSIFGDLFASLVKRQFGVKDYGKLFPGHGGVMDRFDSTLAVAIAVGLLSAAWEVFA